MILNFKSKKQIYIIVALLAVLVMLLLIFAGSRKNNQTGNVNSTEEYYDKNSGETVSNPANRTPEKYGVIDEKPLYLGISKLLDKGVTFDQVEATKEALNRFSKSDNKNIKEFSLDIQSIDQIIPKATDPPDTKATMYFNLTTDRTQTYKAKLEYFELTAIHLYVYDSRSNKLIYESGTLSSDSAEVDEDEEDHEN